MSEGGKRTCKYYTACGNTENCKRCTSYEKNKKQNGSKKIFIKN